jgi:hypothetical protein
MAPTSNRRRKFPTALNGGEHQDGADVRVGETHLNAPEGFERSVASQDDAGEAGPDSEFDSGLRPDERLERRDEPTAERTPTAGASSPSSSSSSPDASSRPRDTDRAR